MARAMQGEEAGHAQKAQTPERDPGKKFIQTQEGWGGLQGV